MLQKGKKKWISDSFNFVNRISILIILSYLLLSTEKYLKPKNHSPKNNYVYTYPRTPTLTFESISIFLCVKKLYFIFLMSLTDSIFFSSNFLLSLADDH